MPTREVLNEYWKNITLDNLNNLIVGRLNGVIAGTLQLSYEAPNIESRKNIAQIKRHFVAPWARGYGLAKSMIDYSETKAREENIKSIQLAVRKTQDAAVNYSQVKTIKYGEKILTMLLLMEVMLKEYIFTKICGANYTSN